MLFSTLPSFFFDVTSLQIFDVKLVSMLQFSIFPYSMLLPSIILTFQIFDLASWQNFDKKIEDDCQKHIFFLSQRCKLKKVFEDWNDILDDLPDWMSPLLSHNFKDWSRFQKRDQKKAPSPLTLKFERKKVTSEWKIVVSYKTASRGHSNNMWHFGGDFDKVPHEHSLPF